MPEIKYCSHVLDPILIFIIIYVKCIIYFMQAVLNDQIEIIDYMIIHGSNPLLCDDSGSSTLMMTMNVTLIAKLDAAVQMERWVKLRRRPTKTDFNTESISGQYVSLSYISRALPSNIIFGVEGVRWGGGGLRDRCKLHNTHDACMAGRAFGPQEICGK